MVPKISWGCVCWLIDKERTVLPVAEVAVTLSTLVPAAMVSEMVFVKADWPKGYEHVGSTYALLTGMVTVELTHLLGTPLSQASTSSCATTTKKETSASSSCHHLLRHGVNCCYPSVLLFLLPPSLPSYLPSYLPSFPCTFSYCLHTTYKATIL
jgi:hypothetical protein